jgi:hypothetical protein
MIVLAKILEYNFFFFQRMKLIYPKFTSLFVLLLTSIFICSCGTDESESPVDANQTAFDEDLHPESDDLPSLVDADPEIAEDWESFLDEGETFLPSTATGAEDFAESRPGVEVDGLALLDPNVSEETPALSGEPVDSKSVLADHEAEKALSNLEEGTISHQRSIDELRKINSRKDRTIASLTKLNQELVTEISRLKGKSLEQTVSVLKPDESASDKLFGLRAEVKNLRGNLHIKSKEIQDLRIRNDSLEERISVLELNPSKKLSGSRLSPRQKDLSQIVSSLGPVAPAVDAVKETRLFSGGCNLQFDAVVTALNGKNKEAFYTEFFIIDEDVEGVLRKGGVELSDFSGIDSYAELWARSRKNSFLFPNVQKNIRSLLLKLVENGQGQRVRTDINGAATLENLPSGKFFVVGTASLGKIGVTWDVPVVLRTGANKLSLTLANASWSL